MSYGKGVIGVASHYLGRYREFDRCLAQLKYPEGSIIDWQISLFLPMNYNNMIRTMLTEDFDWVWILGDDHVFNPNLLLNLLKHDVDIVLPLCMTRIPPFQYVIRERKEEGYVGVKDDFLDGKTGLIDITNYTVGNAGILMKRHVAEGIDAPWYENDKDEREMGRCDLIFSQKIKDNGFKMYLDTDSPLGHITHMAIWPRRDSISMKYEAITSPIPFHNRTPKIA